MISTRPIKNTAAAMLEHFAGGMRVEIKAQCQNAAANRFKDIAVNNLGYTGEARPEDWQILSYEYAKEFHDGNRIPTLILSGQMQESIKVDESNQPAFAEVVALSEYAYEQQHGNEENNLPPRPFFPMYGRDDRAVATEYAESQCLAAAQEHLDSILQEMSA
ncbi:MAG: hypothetical protein KGL39_10170 [Patescibacteria group bacterium]|nr:hypothetical protein [Patescibacteria group bacterium]